jgi:hypothetical protein
MLNSEECRAMAAAAKAGAARTSDASSRAHFESMATQWRGVAAMAKWQEEFEARVAGRTTL